MASVLHGVACSWVDDLTFDADGRAETQSGFWQRYGSAADAGVAAGIYLVSEDFHVVLVSRSTCCGYRHSRSLADSLS